MAGYDLLFVVTLIPVLITLITVEDLLFAVVVLLLLFGSYVWLFPVFYTVYHVYVRRLPRLL